MSDASPNQAQIDLWTQAGPIWTSLRERFDRQAGEHGVAAIDALAPAAGEYVVDIGCGAGSSTMQLADAVGSSGRVTGVDVSPTMIDGARALADVQGRANVDFLVADAMVDPVADDADALYSRFGFDVLRRPRSRIRQPAHLAEARWTTRVRLLAVARGQRVGIGADDDRA